MIHEKQSIPRFLHQVGTEARGRHKKRQRAYNVPSQAGHSSVSSHKVPSSRCTF
jgi:hypothetical protein